MKNFEIPGVYEIWIKGTKNFYIGSSTKSIKHRFRQHKYLLKSSRHNNQYFQNCFNKYGQESLVLNVIEELPTNSKEEILEREKFWIQKLQPNLNIQKDPTIPGADNNGEKHGFSKLKNEEISTIKGLVTQGLGWKEISEIVDLSHYNDPASLVKVLRYDTRWREVALDKKYEIIYEMISPTGKTYTTNNLFKFKKENDCVWWVSHIFDLINNKITTKDKRLNGWNCKILVYPQLDFIYQSKILHCRLKNLSVLALKRGQQSIKAKKNNIYYFIFNYLGEFYFTKDIESFCHQNNLTESLLKGTKYRPKRSHRGWLLRSFDFDDYIEIERYKIVTAENEIILSPANTLCEISISLGLPRRRLTYAFKSQNIVNGYSVIKQIVCYSKNRGKWDCVIT